jgi:hypothetical protein
MDRRALATIAFVCAATASVGLMGCGASATTVTVTKTVERTTAANPTSTYGQCKSLINTISVDKQLLLNRPALANDILFFERYEHEIHDLGYYCATWDDLERALLDAPLLPLFTRKEWCANTPLVGSRLCSYGDDPA